MSKELSELEKQLQQTKKQFLTTATRATRELDSRRKALRKEITRANTRAKRARADLQKESERLANTTATKARRELKKQIRKLEKMLDGARSDAARLRNDLAPVMTDLGNARDHLSHALHVDRAMAKIRRQLARFASSLPTCRCAAALLEQGSHPGPSAFWSVIRLPAWKCRFRY